MPRSKLSESLPGEGRRSLRKGVVMQARVRDRGTPFNLKVIDLSTTGFRGETVYRLPLGSRVYVTLPGLAPIEAKVMWRDPRFVGCAFANPLHPAIFDHIVAHRG